MKYLILIIAFQSLFSQNKNNHGINVGLMNQVTFVSFNYDYIMQNNYRFTFGYSEGFGAYNTIKEKPNRVKYYDDALLISAHYLFGSEKNSSIGLGVSQALDLSENEFHLLVAYNDWTSDLYYRIGLNLVLDKYFYQKGEGEMASLRGLFYYSLNIGYSF